MKAHQEWLSLSSSEALRDSGKFRMSKQEVIKLILHINKFDREYAKMVYARENALHPQWLLKEAFELLKAGK